MSLWSSLFERKQGWSAAELPSLSGRTAVITGANSGIGLEAARVFAVHGARVILACRDTNKGEAAAKRVRDEGVAGELKVRALDVSSLKSVRAFAESVQREAPEVHALVNNAGVMALPRSLTVDGFETQFATNHLGHFALTGLLLPSLRAAGDARVVTVSSGVHAVGFMRFDDLMGERRYSRAFAYAQSKLANLLFAFELGRRFERAGWSARSVACHPGYAATNLQQTTVRAGGDHALSRWLMNVGNGRIAQSAEQGALPTVYAAAAPGVHNGDFIGPAGLLSLAGPPTRVKAAPHAYDLATARRLWERSMELTGVRYEALDAYGSA